MFEPVQCPLAIHSLLDIADARVGDGFDGGVAIRYWTRWVGTLGIGQPSASIAAVWTYGDYFAYHTAGTAMVIAISVPLSLLIGASLGATAAVFPKMSNAIWAGLVLAQALPIFALGPVVAVLIGESLVKSVIVALLILMFPVALSLYRGMKAIDQDLVDAGR